MLAFLFTLILVLIAVMTPVMKFELKRKPSIFPWRGTLCGILVIVLFFVGFDVFNNTVIGNAQIVGTLNELRVNTQEEIYYDNDSDTYFVVMMHDFNPTKLFYRYTLNGEEVDAYIEQQKSIDEINLFD